MVYIILLLFLPNILFFSLLRDKILHNVCLFLVNLKSDSESWTLYVLVSGASSLWFFFRSQVTVSEVRSLFPKSGHCFRSQIIVFPEVRSLFFSKVRSLFFVRSQVIVVFF